MPGKLTSWPRPHFAPGGGKALLFFVAFGEFDLTKPLSQSKYRTNGPADLLDVVHLTRDKQAQAIAEYQSGPLWANMTRDAPVTAAEALKAPQAVAVRAE